MKHRISRSADRRKSLASLQTAKGDPFEAAAGALLLVDLLCGAEPRALPVRMSIIEVGAQPTLESAGRADYFVLLQAQDMHLRALVEIKNRALILNQADEWIVDVFKRFAEELDAENYAFAFLLLPPHADAQAYRDLTQAARCGGLADHSAFSASQQRAYELMMRGLDGYEIDALLQRIYVDTLPAPDLLHGEKAAMFDIQRAYGRCTFIPAVVHELHRIAANSRFLQFRFTKPGLRSELRRRNCDPTLRRADLRQGNRLQKIGAVVLAVATLAAAAWWPTAQVLQRIDARDLLARADDLAPENHDQALILAASALHEDPQLLPEAMRLIQRDKHFVRRMPGAYDEGVLSDDGAYLAGIEAQRMDVARRRVRFFDLAAKRELSPFTVLDSDRYHICALANDTIALVGSGGSGATIGIKDGRGPTHFFQAGAVAIACAPHRVFIAYPHELDAYEASNWKRAFRSPSAYPYPREVAIDPSGRYVVEVRYGGLLVKDARGGHLVASLPDRHGIQHVTFRGPNRLIFNETLFSPALVTVTFPSLQRLSVQPLDEADYDGLRATATGVVSVAQGTLELPDAQSPVIMVGGPTRALTWSRDGSLIITASDRGLILTSVYDIDPLLAGIYWPQDKGAQYAFCPDDALVSSGLDHDIERLDLRTWTSTTLALDTSPQHSVAVACAGVPSHVVTLSAYARSALVWDAQSQALRLHSTIRLGRAITDVALDTSGHTLTALLQDGRVFRVDVASGNALDVTPAGKRYSTMDGIRELSPTGQHLYIDDPFAQRSVFDLLARSRFTLPRSTEIFVGFSPDERKFATSGLDGITIRSTRDGAVLGRLQIPLGAGSFGADGRQFLSKRYTIGNDAQLQLWDLRTGAPLGEPFGTTLVGYNLPVLSPDGQYAAASTGIISSEYRSPVVVWAVGAMSLQRLACWRSGGDAVALARDPCPT